MNNMSCILTGMTLFSIEGEAHDTGIKINTIHSRATVYFDNNLKN
jgi:hypothetical protein